MEGKLITEVTVIRNGLNFGGYLPGEMGKAKDGLWVIACPICSDLGELRNHQVTENQDGTVTVSPSLVCHGSIFRAPRVYEPCTAHYFIEHNQIRWC